MVKISITALALLMLASPAFAVPEGMTPGMTGTNPGISAKGGIPGISQIGGKPAGGGNSDGNGPGKGGGNAK
jgi:hypothetical protein